MSSVNSKKRARQSGSISPPPLRRKLQSTTTTTAVASFFTPTSQKAPEKLIWQERAPDDDTPATLLVGRSEPTTDNSGRNGNIKQRRNKIAAFDFDSTLIRTASGKAHASDGQDWKWWDLSVPVILRKLHKEQGYRVIIISNQAGIALKSDKKGRKAQQSRLSSFKTKVSAVFNQLDLPLSIYAATEKDIYRKPRTGMWKEILEDYDLDPSTIDLQRSFFVGDAGGRLASGGKPKDFSSSDRNFAANVGIAFHTPEEYFLEEEPRPFIRTFEPSEYLLRDSAAKEDPLYSKNNEQDIVLFCGSPGSGKSSFYWNHLRILGYERVNQDTLKSREKCLKVAATCLEEGQSVVVDNTNPDSDVRAYWTRLAHKFQVPIRCVLFTADAGVCEHNDAVRAHNRYANPEKRAILPAIAFTGFASRYQRPDVSEGFQDITEVPFIFRGSEMEREIWTKYWT